MSTHYETLGVEQSASADEIRAAYRKAARDAHPDREGGSTERMQAVNAAYEVLSDAQRRQAYDELGALDPESPEAKAQAHLDHIFRDAINEGLDPIGHAMMKLQDAPAMLKAQAVGIQRRIDAIKAMQGMHRRKGGKRNRIEDLLGQRLTQLEGEHRLCVEAINLAHATLALLGEYEKLVPDKPKTWVNTLANIAMAQQATGYR